MLVAEAENLPAAYTRLTEKFKALWTFHQFLKGAHQTFLGDTPPHEIDFGGIYDRLRDVSGEVSIAAVSGSAREKLDRIETDLSLASKALRESEGRLSPSLLRRFFARVQPQDPKIVYQLLRFYFAQPELDNDTADKVDFLVTLAALRSDSAEPVARERDEAIRLFEAIVAGCDWPAIPEDEADALVAAMDELTRDVSRARSFEELVRERRIENMRTIKHSLGFALAHPRVLASMGMANARTRAVFHRLFEEERTRIQEAIGRVESLEREISHAGPVPEEFRRFHDFREEFSRLEDESNVRAGDLLALKNRVRGVLDKFDLGQVASDEIDEALEFDESSPEAASEHSGALKEAIEKVLATVEMGDGSLKGVAHMGLENWEVRAAKRVIAAGSRPVSDRDALLLEGAALRVRADDESGQWIRARKMGRALDALQGEAAETLRLAAEADRRFAELIAEVREGSLPEELKSLVRSRFRLLHAYTALWLLADEVP